MAISEINTQVFLETESIEHTNCQSRLGWRRILRLIWRSSILSNNTMLCHTSNKSLSRETISGHRRRDISLHHVLRGVAARTERAAQPNAEAPLRLVRLHLYLLPPLHHPLSYVKASDSNYSQPLCTTCCPFYKTILSIVTEGVEKYVSVRHWQVFHVS